MFIMFIYGTVDHTHQCLEKANCLIHCSEIQREIFNYLCLQITFSVQWQNIAVGFIPRVFIGMLLEMNFGRNCLTDNDISFGNYTVDQIEFVHELYFVIVSHNSVCIPVGYNWDTPGYKDIRYIVKVIFVNGIFRTAYPVSCDHVLLWLQYQAQGIPQWIQAAHMTLVDAVSRTVGKQLNVIVSWCLEVNINVLVYQAAESLLSQANGIDSMRTYTAVICQNQQEPSHIKVFINLMNHLSVHFDLKLLLPCVMQNLGNLCIILNRVQRQQSKSSGMSQ